jgi:hypothetical protein
MAEENPQPVDLWEVLDEAVETVEKWPSWQQQYDADVSEEDACARAITPHRPFGHLLPSRGEKATY